MSSLQVTMATTSDLWAIMKERGQKYVDLVNAGDKKGLAQMYTTDAKVLNPGQKTLNGKEEIAKAFEDDLLADDESMEFTLEDVFGKNGDEFVTSRASFKLVSKDGAKTITGKNVVVWKFMDGVYLAHVDISNMDE
ncbi:uncharacterized protein [Ptychodera flava]|uniref:uncharacterized protein isoform X3 n=1 Tax=Ptychodera flava TaxID=63121 RepID=UPI003969C6B3